MEELESREDSFLEWLDEEETDLELDREVWSEYDLFLCLGQNLEKHLRENSVQFLKIVSRLTN
jgi:hypothetical protein